MNNYLLDIKICNIVCGTYSNTQYLYKIKHNKISFSVFLDKFEEVQIIYTLLSKEMLKYKIVHNCLKNIETRHTISM